MMKGCGAFSIPNTRANGLRVGLAFTFPTKLAVGFLDGQVVDAGEAEFHVAAFVELPVLVAVGAIPLAGVVVKLILEAHRDAVAREGPEFLLQAVIQLAIPFAAQKLDDLRAAVQELGTVAPMRVLGVGERDALGVAAVPGVLGGLDFLARGFFGEWRQWWSWVHVSFRVSDCSQVERCVAS